jgi:hypothetical protein
MYSTDGRPVAQGPVPVASAPSASVTVGVNQPLLAPQPQVAVAVAQPYGVAPQYGGQPQPQYGAPVPQAQGYPPNMIVVAQPVVGQPMPYGAIPVQPQPQGYQQSHILSNGYSNIPASPPGAGSPGSGVEGDGSPVDTIMSTQGKAGRLNEGLADTIYDVPTNYHFGSLFLNMLLLGLLVAGGATGVTYIFIGAGLVYIFYMIETLCCATAKYLNNVCDISPSLTSSASSTNQPMIDHAIDLSR